MGTGLRPIGNGSPGGRPASRAASAPDARVAMTPNRLPLIDVARTVALVAMAVFHLGRDLDVLQVWPPGSTFTPGWMWSARLIAGSFVFLAGVSLWLAHGQAIRWNSYLRRLGLLIAAAAAVSIATYFTFPGAWVRFGILHSIAASSVIGLAFLRLPALVTLAAGVAVLWIGATTTTPLPPPLSLWLGLAPASVPMMDWEPLFPWTGPFLLGLGAAKLAQSTGALERLRGWPTSPLWHRFGWPGRHSLVIYLIHQPILVGAILGWVWLTT